jgi:hypothetical protein
MSKTFLYNINASSGNLVATNASVSSMVSSNITAGTLTNTNLINTNISSSNAVITNVIGTNISAGTLSGTTITGGNLSLSGNLVVGGTLTTVNITSTNILNTNISAGTVNATGLSSLQNLTATNISTSTLIATTSVSSGLLSATNVAGSVTSAGNLIATTGTIPNMVNTNLSTGTINSTGLTTGAINSSGLTTGNINFTGSLFQNGTPYLGSQWTTTAGNVSYTSGSVVSTNIVNTNLSAGTINSSGLTTGNINFTGSLFQNGTPYLGSQWTTTAGNVSYTSGSVVSTDIVNTNLSTGTLNGSNATVSNIVGTNVSSGTIRATTIVGSTSVSSGLLAATNATATNLVSTAFSSGSVNATTIVGSTSVSSGLLAATNATATNLVSTAFSSGSVNATTIVGSTSVSSGLLAATNVTATNLVSTAFSSGSVNATTIVGSTSVSSGLLAATNVTATNLVSTAFSSGSVNATTIVGSTSVSSGLLAATNATATNLVSTAFSSGSVNATTIVGSTSVSSGLLAATNATATNLVSTAFSSGTVNATTIVGSTSVSSGLLAATNATATNLVSTAFTSGSVNATTIVGSTSVSSGLLAATNATATNLVSTAFSSGSVNATTIVGSTSVSSGLLAATNATATNLVSTAFSSGTVNASTGITTAALLTTGLISAANLAATTSTIPNIVHTNISTGVLIASTGITTANIIAGNTAGYLFVGTTGNVGINTSTGSYRFDINNTTGSVTMRISGSGVDGPVIRYQNDGTGGLTYHIGSTNSGSGAGKGFSFFDVTNSATRMLIGSSGNIGIATAIPSYTLDVNGTLNASTITGGSASLSGTLSAPNIVGTNISASTLSAPTITGGNLSLSGNLTIAGTLTTVNITSTNVLQTNVSAGTIASTNATTTNIVGTNISSGTVRATTSLFATGTSNTLGNIYTTGGNVGIATTTPSARLDVNGSGKFSGANNTFTITGTGETDITTLYLGTPFNSSSGYKSAIIAQGGPGWSRSNMHFCLDSSSDNGITAGISHSRMIIRGDTGNVGIGTTNPGYTLDINGTFDASNSNGVMIFASSGNVFIGTSSNTASGFSSGNLTLYGTNSSNNGIAIDGLGNSTLQFLNSRTVKGAVALIATAGSWSTDSRVGDMVMRCNSNQSILFNTNAGSGASSMIVSGGNVGIGTGTSTPGERLDVRGNLRVGGDNNNYISFYGTTGDIGSNHTYIGERIWGGSENSELLLFKGNDMGDPDRIRLFASEHRFDTYTAGVSGTFSEVGAASGSTRMIIANGGNVGIATTSPAYTLDVIGRIKASSSLLVGTSTDTESSRFISALDSSQGTGTTKLITFGQANSNNNQSEIGFAYAGAGSTSNALTLGLHGGEKMRVQANGNVGIGTTSPSGMLHLNNAALFTSTGNLTCTGDIISFGSLSDRRLKKNIESIGVEKALDVVSKLRAVTFDWKDDIFNEQKRNTSDIGFIAQEIEEIIPEAVSEYTQIESGEVYKNIKHERIIPYLLTAIQYLLKEREH